MRGGPLASDMRAINYLFTQGNSVAEVSKRLGIAEEGLVEFAPDLCDSDDEEEYDFPPKTDDEKREAKNAKRRAARAAKKDEG